MATFILHNVRSSGLLDALHELEDHNHLSKRAIRIRGVRLPVARPLAPAIRRPTAGRAGRAGGAGGFRGTGQAIVMAAGAFALEKLWHWRWYAIGGVGAYVLIRVGMCFRHRRRNLRAQIPVQAYSDENSDAQEILSAYLLEMLNKENCSSLDVYTAAASFEADHQITGPAVAFYCVEHLHLKVVSHINFQATFMEDVMRCLNRLKRMPLSSANQRNVNTVHQIGNGITFCGLSKAGQAIGLIISQQLCDNACWDCCSESIEEPIFVERSYADLSYMAARRFDSSRTTIMENVAGNPDFIMFACDGVCDLVQNLALVQFAYQGVRSGMPLRPLCETLLELMQYSGLNRGVLVVQFKPPCDTPVPIDLGNGHSSSGGSDV